MSAQVCSSCKATEDLHSIRKGVTKCSKCVCDQIGRSTMDLLRKALIKVNPPTHLLVASSGGPASTFLYHLLKARINTQHTGSRNVVKKVELLEKMDSFSLKKATDYAKEHGFNCLVLGETADFISSSCLGHLANGCVDFLSTVSTDDFTSFAPVSVLRPVRESLHEETALYCRFNNLEFDDTPSPQQTAFVHEFDLMKRLLRENQGSVPFAVQRMSERLSPITDPCRCSSCNLPQSKPTEKCLSCTKIEAVSNK